MKTLFYSLKHSTRVSDIALLSTLQIYEYFFICQVFFKLFFKKTCFLYKNSYLCSDFSSFSILISHPCETKVSTLGWHYLFLAPHCRVVFPIAVERWCFPVNAIQMLRIVIVGYAEAYSPFVLHSLAEARVARLEQSVKLVSLPKHIERACDNENVIAFLEALVVKSVFLCHTSILFISQCYL